MIALFVIAGVLICGVALLGLYVIADAISQMIDERSE